MSVSKTEIANMALSHIGVSNKIGDLDTEQSQEAIACRTFYDLVRKAVLQDNDWTFAEKTVPLNLIRFDDKLGEYIYQYPVDCLYARNVKHPRNVGKYDKRDFIVRKEASGKAIVTRYEEAQITYTENLIQTGFFSPLFSLALSIKLAIYIAPRLTDGDPFKIKNDLIAMYDAEVGLAKSVDMNETECSNLPCSPYIIARDV